MSRQTSLFGFGFGAISVNETSGRQASLTALCINEGASVPFVPPPNPGNTGNGKKGGSPGQEKKAQAYFAKVEFVRRKRKRHEYENDATSFIPAQYLSPGASRSSMLGQSAADIRVAMRRIDISPSGHTVRKH